VGRYPLVLKTASPQPLSEREGLGTLPFGEGREGHSLSTKSVAPPRWFTPKKIKKGDHIVRLLFWRYEKS